MKKQNLYLLTTTLSLCCFFISCQKKESIIDEIDQTPTVCVKEDFLGSWSGSASCDSSTINSFSFNVIVDGDSLITQWAGNDLSTTIENCNFYAYKPTSTNRVLEFDGELIDGELRVIFSDIGGPFEDDRCDVILK